MKRKPSSRVRLIKLLKRRLGTRQFVGCMKVSQACNVSLHTVYMWIDEGLIEAINVGPSGKRPYFRIDARSVVAFWKSRQRSGTGL